MSDRQPTNARLVPKERPATAWVPLLAVAGVLVLIQLLTAGNYGIFRDEHYYLACARHLAWGYVDQPPLSIAVLAGVRAIFGEGVFALRVVPALCAAALVILVGLIAARFGGGRYAQALAAVAVAISGVVQVITGYYSMNALDLVVWTAAWVLLAQWVVDAEPRRMIWLGALFGLGLMNKIGLLIFGAAIALALPLTPKRRVLRTPAPYLGGALAALVFLPHVVWQAIHGWPTLEFIANAQRHKISDLSPGAFLVEVVLEQHPTNLLVWTAGLGWLLFAVGGRRFRLLGLIFVLGLALLMSQRAKPYYAAGLFPVLFAAGACAWEGFTAGSRRRWLRPALLALLVASGVFFLPLGVPVLTVETYARWQAWTGITPVSQEVGHTSELPQHYSDRFGWKELAAEVSRIVEKLPPEERTRAVIVARNYGEAGALEYWHELHRLPVFSGHNSYWFWTPEELALDTVIVVGWDEEDVRGAFAEVERVGTLVSPWALEDGLPIWLARRPTLPWQVVRERIRIFI